MAKRVWKCAIPAICVILQCLGILIPAEASQKFFSPSGAILETRPDYGRMPVHFIPNRGQVDGRAAYYIQGKDKTIFFSPEGLTFVLSGIRPEPGTLPGQAITPTTARESRWVVKLDFLGARPGVEPVGTDETGTAISYFQGAPGEWKTGLPAYARVVYANIWPGIDLAYTGTQDKLKYEFVVRPGADPSQIRLAYRGADAVSVDRDGRLAVSTPAGGFEDGIPVAYQDKAGARAAVAMSYKILDGSQSEKETAGAPDRDKGAVVYGFTVGDYDRSLPLVLDPVLLIYCGFFGGAGADYGYGIAADSTGSAYITGYTYAPGAAFPTQVGPDLTYNGGSMDAFVAKLTPDGTGYVYCGYIGGAGNDYGYGIAIDAFGSAYVTGYTSSDQGTFPVKVGPSLKFSGNYDAFVAKVNPTGTGLDYCGYIGGSGPDFGKGIAVDGTGNAYVCGYTDSTEADFPVKVGPVLTYSGGYDAFVAKVAPDGSQLVFCGYVGGTGEDVANAIAVDGLNCVYIAGFTFSTETSFPVAFGPVTTHAGLSDAFVAKINNDGLSFAYCGYIGGGASDVATGIAVDLSYNAYVCGYTNSTETTFPVATGPTLTYVGGAYDAFVAKLEPLEGTITYLGYIGGTLYDVATAIAIDGRGYAFVAGYTSSTESSFPVTVGPFLIHSASYDAYVAKVDWTGSKLVFCTYLGGTEADFAQGIALDKDGSGNVYVIGNTYSKEDTFPTQTGPDLTAHGDSDGFVAKLQEISLAVTSPNGGEILRVGFNDIITWLTSGEVDKVTIQYSVDDGTNWFMVASNIPNTGSYLWEVPDDVSANCLIQISEAETGDPTDQSDAIFTISNDPLVAVSSPNGGDQWVVGSTHNITWKTGGTVADLLVEYSTDGGTTWTTIIADVQNQGSYAWVVPNEVSDNCLVRLTEIVDTTVTDTSDAVFSIVAADGPRSLAVTSPNGGEVLRVGWKDNITWSTVGNIQRVTIQYSIDDGTNWYMVASDIPNTNSYVWDVPDDVGTKCLIKISEASTGHPYDVSDAVFTISNDPVVVITSPNGGEKWAVGSSHAITWKTGGTVADLLIEYSTDGGTTWATIIADVQNQGSYAWVVPNTISDACLVRMTQIVGTSVTDTSDAVFSIVPAGSSLATDKRTTRANGSSSAGAVQGRIRKGGLK